MTAFHPVTETSQPSARVTDELWDVSSSCPRYRPASPRTQLDTCYEYRDLYIIVIVNSEDKGRVPPNIYPGHTNRKISQYLTLVRLPLNDGNHNLLESLHGRGAPTTLATL